MGISETLNGFFKKYGMAMLTVMLMMTSGLASAATTGGVDTGTSSMNALNTWLMTWIPIGAALGIVGVAGAWIFGMVPMSITVRVAIGLIVMGSASYIVGMFGLTTA